MSRHDTPAPQWVLEVTGTQGDVRHHWAIQPGSGLLGRGSHCTYRVDDPDRVLSREHAVLECLNGQLYWTQRGGNPTERAGVSLPEGVRTPLKQGDELLAGHCVFRVQQQSAAAAAWQLPASPVVSQDDPLAWLDSLDEQAPRNVMSVDDLLGPALASAEPVAAPAVAHVPQHALNHHIPRGPVASGSIHEPVAAPLPQPWNGEEALRQCLDLILKLVAVRRALRIELGTRHTVIQPRQNNPLKFAASVEHAMSLLPNGPGSSPYLPLNQALSEVSEELLAHQSLMLDGLRTLMNRLDHSLSPKALEAQLGDEGLIGLPLASRRKAQLWDLYCTQYALLNGLTGEPFGALVRQVFSELLEPGGPA